MPAMRNANHPQLAAATVPVLGALAAAVPLRSALADADAECEALARLAHEIQTL